MAIYSDVFVVYERLASAKMMSLVSAINSHTHDGTNGVQINFSNLAGTILASQIAAGTITTSMISDYSQYAVYAP